MKDKKKKQQKKVRRPNPFLYYPLCLIAGLYCRLRLGTRFDRKAIRGIQGPALFLCPHISNIDFILVALALFPHRPTFVGSEHFMARPLIRWFFRRMAVVPKKMYCADIRTILTVMRVKEQGHLIVLFPEGRLTCFGHSVNLTEGTAELVKKLGIPVYSITGNGAYLTLPKWGKSGIRPGRIQVDSACVLSAEDVASMSLAEIEEALECAVYHDEDQVARTMMADVSYRCKAPAKGLDGILYQCPVCGGKFQTEAAGDRIRCRVCGMEARLDEHYVLHGGPFDSINQWYLWQQDQIDLDTPLESDVTVAAVGPDGNRDLSAGSGRIRMDRDHFTFVGQVFGEDLSFTLSTAAVKALPASVGSHFDIYYNKIMYNMYPQPDPRVTIQWVAFLDKLNGNIRQR
ncbi:MAG: lysophospholipid acyltransferase family protein [Firmicutes bacterium]|nr:1-acyl-sn-glycerol-3-phosphate acyltransferase [Bacillota bacterium]MDD7601370.1 lysophospholipid acyltransferase family protein [Bacillota bacterium]MDY5856333.1 lysophospholipid acyltransferase family protein [Anaerovoracaceae bacterium]